MDILHLPEVFKPIQNHVFSRKNRILNLRHLRNRKIRREQYQTAHMKLFRDLGSNSCSQRMSEKNNVFALHSMRLEAVDITARVSIETSLCRLAGQSTVSAVLRDEKAISGSNVRIANLRVTKQTVPISMKENECIRFARRRRIPGFQVNPVRGPDWKFAQRFVCSCLTKAHIGVAGIVEEASLEYKQEKQAEDVHRDSNAKDAAKYFHHGSSSHAKPGP